MADMTSFKTKLADKAEANHGLPHICLKCTSDFDMDLSKLITVDNRGEDESDGQVASRYVDEICDALAKPENEGIVKKLDLVVSAFRDKIKGSKQALHDIREHAREIAGYMEKGKDDMLAKDPFVSTHLNLTTLSEDYPVWEWNGPKLIGAPSYIKERVGAKLVAEDAEVPTEYDYRLFLMSLNKLTQRVPMMEASLPDDTKATLIDTIVETLGEVVTKEAAAEVVDVLTGAKNIRQIILDFSRLQSMPPSELFNRIKMFDSFIQKYYPIVDALLNDQVELSDDEGSEGLRSNAESIRVLCEFMAYFELMERDTVFRQSILLQGGLINADEKAAYEEAGGTKLMLAHYIRFMYKDDVAKIPAHGISSKVIIESAAHNEKVVKADISNIENRIAVATTQAKVTVFTTVAHRYLVDKINRDRPDDTPAARTVFIGRFMDGLVKKIAERIRHHDIAFVDAALMLIIEADYHGTFVEQLYNQLGAAYLAKMKEADGSVSDLDLKVAEMGVVAQMVANFIVEHMVEVCPCKDMTNKSPKVPSQEE